MQFNELPDSSCSRPCVLIASIDASVFSIEKSFVQRLTVSRYEDDTLLNLLHRGLFGFWLLENSRQNKRNIILRLKRAKSSSEIVVEAYLILSYLMMPV